MSISTRQFRSSFKVFDFVFRLFWIDRPQKSFFFFYFPIKKCRDNCSRFVRFFFIPLCARKNSQRNEKNNEEKTGKNCNEHQTVSKETNQHIHDRQWQRRRRLKKSTMRFFPLFIVHLLFILASASFLSFLFYSLVFLVSHAQRTGCLCTHRNLRRNTSFKINEQTNEQTEQKHHEKNTLFSLALEMRSAQTHSPRIETRETVQHTLSTDNERMSRPKRNRSESKLKLWKQRREWAQ